MKNNRFIIGLLSLFSFTLILPAPLHAQEKDVFSDCGEFKLEAWEGDKKTNNDFDLAFEEAQKTYHDYMSCLFGTAFDQVLKEKGKSTKKTKGELSAQINSINWMLPGQACIKEDELINSIKSTSPQQVLSKALPALEAYKAFLFNFYKEFDENGSLGEVPQDIAELAGTSIQRLNLILQKNRRQINNEIESSLIALEISLNSLKELRLSFVAHVRLQCILQQLGSYQQLLGDVRRVIEGLPNALKNASVTP